MDPISGKEEVLDLVVCSPIVLGWNPEFMVGDCIGSDHLPLHCSIQYDSPHSENPIFYRKVSQIDCTRFKEIIESRVNHLPENYESARDLDLIADTLPVIVREAFEEACPLKKVEKGRRPISPLIMGLIKKKKKLRRLKNSTTLTGNLLQAQSFQREMNSENITFILQSLYIQSVTNLPIIYPNQAIC